MKYFLDTHIFIWHAEATPQISFEVLSEIRNPLNTVYVSHVCFWEITIKMSLGKLKMSISIPELQQLLFNNNFQVIGIDFNHYESLQTLPHYHSDPFDRMLIAQAISEDFTIITQDQKFGLYEPSVKIFWN